ncbi:MAG: cyclic nucleotide-binding domain-containing protein [Cyclobacteriaceae bacterium]
MKSTQQTIALLKQVREFEGLPDEQIKWLSQRGKVLQVTAGDYLFKKGEPAQHMYIMLQGKLQLKAPQGKQLREVDELEPGRITGVLPYSRMTHAAGYGMAYTDVEVLSLHQSYFREMSQDCPEMVQVLVSIMTNRTRSYTRQEQQNERMATLGKLSAVYRASEGLKALLIEKRAPGGQAGTSSRIENYLGFPNGLSGSDLTRRAISQAQRLGTEFLSPREVAEIRLKDTYKIVVLTDGSEIKTRSIIISTGVNYRKLEAEGLSGFSGAGVYYGAAITEAQACQDKDIFIVGGGNSAGQAAMYLYN